MQKAAEMSAKARIISQCAQTRATAQCLIPPLARALDSCHSILAALARSELRLQDHMCSAD